MPRTTAVIAKIEADILESIKDADLPDDVKAMLRAREVLIGYLAEDAPSEPKPRKARRKKDASE